MTSIIPSLTKVVGESNILTDPSDCWAYGYDNSRKHAQPAVVVFPNCHSDTVQIVKICYENGTPITAHGRGTSTTGASIPAQGGVVLSFEKMARIVKLDLENRVITVEPGITNQEVQTELAKHGFFWPPDPTSSAFSTIGGNIALNSAGPRALKYGTPRENVLGLKAISGKGEEIRTGFYTTKGVVGYDLTRLLIGSEGTLAIITEATLKITPVAQAKRTIHAIYSEIEQTTRAIARIMSQSIIPYALEFIDGGALALIRQYSDVELPDLAGGLLIIELDGQESCLDSAITSISEVLQDPGLIVLKTPKNPTEIEQMWATRKALSPALRRVAPKKINEDVVVPVANIPHLIAELELMAKKFNIKIINFGHAGNGNIHVNLLIDPDDPEQVENAEKCLDEIFSLVIELRGTISGEHGIGVEKMKFVSRQFEPTTLQLMKSIKQLFDPKNILNPGKVLP